MKDLFLIIAAIAIAIIILNRAIWSAVKLIGNDILVIFEKLNCIIEQLHRLEVSISTLEEKLEKMAEGQGAEEVEEETDPPAIPTWVPQCNHKIPQYGCPDCIRSARGQEVGTPSDLSVKN